MIHKFEAIRKDSCTRENVYVFIDEAHRSVAKELGTYLMAAVPNATIVGFTGTPIDKTAQGEGTFKIFGYEDEHGYLDKYSIKESIEDETTLPIKHVLAPSEMTVPVDRLDNEFFELAKDEGITEIEELNRVLDRAVALTFLKADDRVAKVAAFVAEHFKENVQPLGYKAFVVAVDREACAKYKQALDNLLSPGCTEPVYTENASDIVDRPLVAQLQLNAEREADVRALFKKPSEDPKILIVTDKLLTGYDAPLLYCLYLDKPMRDHVLLQAIARVNRPYVDSEGIRKRVGLVIDFVGVLRELKKALKFDSEDVSGVIEDLDLLLENFLTKIDAVSATYLDAGEGGDADERLERVVYGRFIDPDVRKTFYEAYKDIESLWEILSPSPELRDHIDTFKRLTQLYMAVRNAYAEKVGPIDDLARKTRRLVEQSALQSGLGQVAKRHLRREDAREPACGEGLRRRQGVQPCARPTGRDRRGAGSRADSCAAEGLCRGHPEGPGVAHDHGPGRHGYPGRSRGREGSGVPLGAGDGPFDESIRRVLAASGRPRSQGRRDRRARAGAPSRGPPGPDSQCCAESGRAASSAGRPLSAAVGTAK
jgi:type I restriction enzyme, R subunit